VKKKDGFGKTLEGGGKDRQNGSNGYTPKKGGCPHGYCSGLGKKEEVSRKKLQGGGKVKRVGTDPQKKKKKSFHRRLKKSGGGGKVLK